MPGNAWIHTRIFAQPPHGQDAAEEHTLGSLLELGRHRRTGAKEYPRATLHHRGPLKRLQVSRNVCGEEETLLLNLGASQGRNVCKRCPEQASRQGSHCRRLALGQCFACRQPHRRHARTGRQGAAGGGAVSEPQESTILVRRDPPDPAQAVSFQGRRGLPDQARHPFLDVRTTCMLTCSCRQAAHPRVTPASWPCSGASRAP